MNKATLNNKGSVLIWTVLLGVALTSVFFFYAVRFQSAAEVQRETMEKQNAEAFLQSYVDYLKTNPTSYAGPIDFEGITGNLQNQVIAITDFLDAGEEVAYDFTGDANLNGDSLIIEWNICNEEVNDLLIQNTLENGKACTSTEYANKKTYAITTDLDLINDPLTLKAVEGPLHYRITRGSGEKLTDNKWHLNASISLQYGKKIEVTETFE